MKISVQYATLIVKNLEESVEFYRNVLGFAPGYHVDLPQGERITIMESPDGASYPRRAATRTACSPSFARKTCASNLLTLSYPVQLACAHGSTDRATDF